MNPALLSTTYLTRPRASLARIIGDSVWDRVWARMNAMCLIRPRLSSPRRPFPFMRPGPIGEFRYYDPLGAAFFVDTGEPVRPYWWWDRSVDLRSLDPLERILMEGA